MTALFLLAALVSAPCEEVRIEATLDPSMRSISGVAKCIRPKVDPKHIEIWNYPAILGDGKDTPENEVPWTYPRGYSSAQMRLRVNDGPWLPAQKRVSVQSTDETTPLSVQFTTRIPIRNGSFAYRDGTLFLGGGWFPLFRDKDQQHCGPSDISYRISLPKPLAGAVGNQPIRGGKEAVGRFTGRDLPIILTEAGTLTTSLSAVVLFPKKKRMRDLQLPLHLQDASSGQDVRALGELKKTLDQGRQFAAGVQLPTPPLLVVIAPIRQHLVEPVETGFLLSDRAFHLWDYEPFLKFHRLQVWKSQIDYYVRQHYGERENGTYREQELEFLSAAFLDKLLFETYGKAEYAPDMLEPFAIIPQIETLIYAPQIPFRSTYYNATYDETDPRNLPSDFYSQLNSGRLLYDKLVGKLGRAKAQELLHGFLREEQSWSSFLKSSLSSEDLKYIHHWRTGYPIIDYTVAFSGTKGTDSLIRVDAKGPDAGAVKEPLKVRLKDQKGSIHIQERLGPGVITFPGVIAPTDIQLDPDRRLVELHREAGKDPHFNNRVTPKWNFLLNNVSGLISLTDSGLSLGINFSLRRNYDLRWKYNFSGYYSPSAFGLGITGSYAFGRQLTPLWLSKRISLAASLNRLREETANSPTGIQASAGLSYRYDTRSNAFSSFRGEGVSAKVVSAYTQTDNADTFLFAQTSLSGLYLWQLGATQAVAARLRGDLTFGTPPPQNGFRLGGRSLGGRGYEMGQIRGRRRVVATVEHRHALVSGMRTDVFGVFTLTRIEGAFFADAIYLDQLDAFSPPSKTARCGNETFADAGYGIRFLVDLMNISPAALTVDVGAPLTRCGLVQEESPIAVYISFAQSLLSF